jgi:hypothetical protein
MAGKQCRLWDPAEPQEIVSALVDALREPAAQPMPWRQGWNAVGFKIEFLDDSTNEFSECMTVDCEDTLAVAEAMARAYARLLRRRFTRPTAIKFETWTPRGVSSV